MMKIFTICGLLAIFVFVYSCQKEVSRNLNRGNYANSTGTSTLSVTADCGTPLVKDLFDMGGVITWGNITVSNDADNIKIAVNNTTQGYFLTKVTIVYGSLQHVTDDLDNQFNWTPCEGPALFDLQKTYPAGTNTSDVILIPNSNFQSDGCIWLNVNVQLQGLVGGLGCAYASPFDGSVIGSAQWQSAFKYCKQTCPPPPGDCGQLRTQTPGGWGAKPAGNNPGTYLHANFSAAFPQGLTIGCAPGNYNVHFSSADAITAYMPGGGTPATLTANFTDPATKALKDELVSQVTALSLSVGFDAYDPSFGKAGINLGSMLIGSGTFTGWTVSDFLAEANKVLGGCDNTYTASQVNDVLDKINNNYVDGTTDKGFLNCPSISPRFQ